MRIKFQFTTPDGRKSTASLSAGIAAAKGFASLEEYAADFERRALANGCTNIERQS